jgi:hypothetical protein
MSKDERPFRVNKQKAALNAGLVVASEESARLGDLLAKSSPHLAVLLGTLRVGSGVMRAYRQEKLNQFTEFLIDNHSCFPPSKVDTKEFQESVNVFLESYLKLRSDEKLKLAQKIFLDCSKSLNIPLYPLERYNDTLEKISQSGLHFLAFINSEIPQLRLAYVKRKMREHGNTTESKSMDEWVDVYGTPKPINFFIEEYLKMTVVEKMSGYKGDKPLFEEDRLKKELREPFTLAESELEQLGLAVSNDTTSGWSSGSHFFGLTDYGKKFISIIKPEEEYKYL